MIKLQTKLQESGHSVSMKEYVIALQTYQIFLPGTKHLPISFDDVLTINKNKDWYKPDKMINLSLLWMEMYGIFRRSFDFWLFDAADK